MIEVIAEDEDDFVEKSLSTPRPCTIWMKADFDQKKIDEATKRRGIVFIKTNIEGDEGNICLQRKNQSLALASALKSSQTKWHAKESTTLTLLPLLSDEKSTETKK